MDDDLQTRWKGGDCLETKRGLTPFTRFERMGILVS
jgi:hypothetical protein